MKVASVLALVLSAAVSTSALSLSFRAATSDGLTESPQLAQLLAEAKQNVNETLEQEQRAGKRSTASKCTLEKLALRRE
jgi:tyrosinase